MSKLRAVAKWGRRWGSLALVLGIGSSFGTYLAQQVSNDREKRFNDRQFDANAVVKRLSERGALEDTIIARMADLDRRLDSLTTDYKVQTGSTPANEAVANQISIQLSTVTRQIDAEAASLSKAVIQRSAKLDTAESVLLSIREETLSNTERVLIIVFSGLASVGLTLLGIRYRTIASIEINPQAPAETDDAADPGVGSNPHQPEDLLRSVNRRIADYHNVVVKQAKLSFKLAQTAMFISLGLLAICILVATLVNSTPAAISVGILGAAGSAITGLVSNTHLRNQEGADRTLREFFLQPVEMARVLACERIIATMKEDHRDAAAELLVVGLMQGASRNHEIAGLGRSRTRGGTPEAQSEVPNH